MKTEAYNPSFGKTLTTGINALVTNKKGRYILEHRVSSKYHQQGEEQEILLDEILLGREKDCHVRFDESFATVSRHHAAIVREGGNWKLVQMSKTNTTFLNGKPINDSWYLQNGDEIQLAINGPKLGFVIPEKPKKYGFTERLISFNDQVIRPYKKAFIVICAVIALIIALCIYGGVVIYQQHKNIETSKNIIEQQRKQIDELYNELMNTNIRLEEEAMMVDSANQESIRAKAAAFKARAEAIQAQNDLETVQSQMQELRNEMDSFYNGIIYKEY